MATFIQQSNTNAVGGAPTSAFDDDPENKNRFIPVNQGGSAYDFRAAGFGQPTSPIPNAGVATAPVDETASTATDGNILNDVQATDTQAGANDKAGGPQHTAGMQDAQISGGMIDDFGNWFDAVQTGVSAIPSTNPVTGIPGAIGFGYNVATGAFSEPYGNWNTIPGFEEAVRARVAAGASVTAAQNAEAAARAAKGQTPQGYEPGSNADVDKAYGAWRDTQPMSDPTKLRDYNLEQIEKLQQTTTPADNPTPNPNQPNGGGAGGGNGGGDGGGGAGGGAGYGTTERATSDVEKGKGGRGGDREGGSTGSGNNSSSSGAKAQDRDFAAGGHVPRYAAGGSVLDQVGTEPMQMPMSMPPAPMAARAAPPSIPMTPAAQALPPADQQARFAPAPSQIQDDGVPDNQPIMADEGEYMLNRESAAILGPELLNLLNDPMMAKTIRDMLDTMVDDDDDDGMGAEADISPIDSDLDGQPQGLYAIQ